MPPAPMEQLPQLGELFPGLSVFSPEFLAYLGQLATAAQNAASKAEVEALREKIVTKEDLVNAHTDIRTEISSLLRPLAHRVGSLTERAGLLVRGVGELPLAGNIRKGCIDQVEQLAIGIRDELHAMTEELQVVCGNPDFEQERDHPSELPEAAQEEGRGSEASMGSGTIGVEEPVASPLIAIPDDTMLPKFVEARRTRAERAARRTRTTVKSIKQGTDKPNLLERPLATAFSKARGSRPRQASSTPISPETATHDSDHLAQTPVGDKVVSGTVSATEQQKDRDEDNENFVRASPFITVRPRKTEKPALQRVEQLQANLEPSAILSPNVTVRNNNKRKGALLTAEDDVPGSPTSSKRAAHPRKQKTTRAKRPR
ncbi:hypothetical protein HK102_004667, partial [Quaeritorhiza haematococci]